MPADPRRPPATTLEERLLARIADLERQVRTISSYFSGGCAQQLPTVDVLPVAGRLGRAVVLSTDKKLYIDNGAAWVAQT